jgi:hypothetical protein
MDLSCPVGMTRWVRSTLYAGCVVCPRRETPEFPHPQQKEPRSILGSLAVTTLTSV